MRLAARPLPVLAAAAIACAALVLGATRIAGPLGEAIGTWPPPAQEAAFALILYGLLALVAAIGRRLAGRGPAEARPPGAPWIVAGAAIGVGGFLLALGDAMLAGAVARGSAPAAVLPLLFGSAVVLGQSASEELFFRGWLQPVLRRGWGAPAAIGITAVAFSALHVAGGARTALELVNLLLGGILFGLLAWRSGGLWPAIAAHAGWNWAETIVFGLQPNPGVGGFGAMHDLELVGPELWGGSPNGVNASVAMTLVLVALVLPLAWRFRSSSAPG